MWGPFIMAAGLLFASFSSSSTYSLKSYSVGPGGTNSAASSTYQTQSNVGEQSNGSSSSTTYTSHNGAIQAEQLNVPVAPTLSNGSNTYYNMLNFTINTTNEPSDATYAVAVSTTSNFATTNYIQASDLLGSGQVYQACNVSGWGTSCSDNLGGLAVNTTYYFKVAAMEGKFTNTEFGAVASISTVNPSITFSVSPSSYGFGTFVPNVVVTSTNLSFTFATNAVSGGNVYVSGQNGGFKSSAHTIAAVSANLATQSEGFGVQGTNPGESSGGPLSVVSPYNGTGNTVGIESSNPANIFTTSNPIVGGIANANVQVKAAYTDPTSGSYQEVLTFVASASF
jgi:hypothetical protein